MLEVILYISIYFPLNMPEPMQVDVPKPSVAACLHDAGVFLEKIKIDMPEATYEISCAVEVPHHVDH